MCVCMRERGGERDQQTGSERTRKDGGRLIVERDGGPAYGGDRGGRVGRLQSKRPGEKEREEERESVRDRESESERESEGQKE